MYSTIVLLFRWIACVHMKQAPSVLLLCRWDTEAPHYLATCSESVCSCDGFRLAPPTVLGPARRAREGVDEMAALSG